MIFAQMVDETATDPKTEERIGIYAADQMTIKSRKKLIEVAFES